MNQIGKQRHRVREQEDRELQPCRDTKHRKADRDRLDTLTRTDDRAVNKPMRMTVVSNVPVLVVFMDVMGIEGASSRVSHVADRVSQGRCGNERRRAQGSERLAS